MSERVDTDTGTGSQAGDDPPATVAPGPEGSPAGSGDAMGTAGPTDAPPLRPQHARRRRNHRIIAWSCVALVILVLSSTGLVAARRIDRPLPPADMAAARLTTSVVPGSRPVPPWPAGGQAAVAIPALGYAEQSGPEQPVPVASLVKMATAVVVLRDHPVPPGSSGPTITVTPDEAAQFGVDLANDETNIPLAAGEPLTELQLLESLLVESANDAAYSLAAWDAGSQQAFVAKLNALATSLGADRSHFVDTSGFDPGSVSTAADSLRIAAAGMAIPTFARVAGMPAITVPWVGPVRNIITAIGTDGIIGVKSGYTSQASGCMVLAGMRSVNGRSVLVLAAALGQLEPAPAPPPAPGATPVPAPAAPATPAAPTTTTTTAPYSAIEAQYPLLYTEPIVEHLLDTSEAAIVPVTLATAGHTVGTARTEWAGTRRVVPVAAGRTAWLLGVPGQPVTSALTPAIRNGAGATGAVRYTLGSQTETVPVHLTRRLTGPGWWWKVLHG